MAGSSKENFPDVILPTRTHGDQNRRPLRDLNGLPGKRTIPFKKPLAPVCRPVTRGFSEQIVAKPSLPVYEGKKPKIQTITDEIYTEDCGIIDVEDDFSAPMFVQHTEAMMEEIDKMDEDVYEEPILDIDNADEGDPLAVVEYIDDIYTHYRKQEILSCVSPCYMSQQYDITDKMRAILVDWLIEVHYKFELMEETLYLTVNLIDRFLECQTVSMKNLQLVGMTAMLLACKYEEVSVPVVDDFIVISDKAYTRTEVLNMEKQMVNTLQFNLSVPTPCVRQEVSQSCKLLQRVGVTIILLG